MAENFHLDDSTEAPECNQETREDYYECIRPFFQRTSQEERLRL